MLVFSGTAIKNRGIKWEEAYGDKSLYLKKSFEEQVGPGSYFRWEGHDSTTGEDYYVVVTPGFSKKKGFHFFAALRKMPAKNGASGKKFRTQAEALSYAYDTWRVPPPKTKPHKPYIVNDLKGKAIVMENVHSSVFPRNIKIGNKIVIDTSLPDTTAMAVMSSGPVGIIEKPVPGLSSQPELKKKPVLQLQPNLANTLNKLIKLANLLDEQGKTQEADAVDKIIKQTVEKSKIFNWN